MTILWVLLSYFFQIKKPPKIGSGSTAATRNYTTAGTLAESVGAGVSWTPTVANLTVGTGTLKGWYSQIGKRVEGYISFTFGSTSSFSGQLTITPPVTIKSGKYGVQTVLGSVHVLGSNNFFGPLLYSSTTSLDPRCYFITGSYQTTNILNATTPMTWVAGNSLDITFTYEAA